VTKHYFSEKEETTVDAYAVMHCILCFIMPLNRKYCASSYNFVLFDPFKKRIMWHIYRILTNFLFNSLFLHTPDTPILLIRFNQTAYNICLCLENEK
jgi:hypothetical protein